MGPSRHLAAIGVFVLVLRGCRLRSYRILDSLQYTIGMLDKKLRSFRYAVTGLRIAAREEFNFKLQIALACTAVFLGVVFGITKIEWLFVFGAIVMVLTAELFNTSLEELCDMLKPTHDPHVAKIKDLAAAAVFAASACALVIGLIVFIPYII